VAVLRPLGKGFAGRVGRQLQDRARRARGCARSHARRTCVACCSGQDVQLGAAGARAVNATICSSDGGKTKRNACTINNHIYQKGRGFPCATGLCLVPNTMYVVADSLGQPWRFDAFRLSPPCHGRTGPMLPSWAATYIRPHVDLDSRITKDSVKVKWLQDFNEC
jgi:hypothetical protein